MDHHEPSPSVGFDQVAIAEALLDLVDDRRGGELVVERGSGFVDYRRTDRAGTTTLLGRAASGPSPRTVLSGDLWDVLRRWVSADQQAADHVFGSDGMLYPSAATAVVDRVERFSRHAETEEDRAVMWAAGVDPGHGVLRRIWFRTGPSSAATLAEVRSRVRRLVETGPTATALEVETVVERLLTYGATAGDDVSPRVVSSGEAAGLLGLRPDDGHEVDIDRPTTAGRTPGSGGGHSRGDVLATVPVDTPLSRLTFPRA